MTTYDKIYAALTSYRELTAQQASAVTGFSVTTCRTAFNRMVGDDVIDTLYEPLLYGGYKLVYLSRENGAQVDLGAMRGMMITKAWVPGELRL